MRPAKRQSQSHREDDESGLDSGSESGSELFIAQHSPPITQKPSSSYSSSLQADIEALLAEGKAATDSIALCSTLAGSMAQHNLKASSTMNYTQDDGDHPGIVRNLPTSKRMNEKQGLMQESQHIPPKQSNQRPQNHKPFETQLTNESSAIQEHHASFESHLTVSAAPNVQDIRENLVHPSRAEQLSQGQQCLDHEFLRLSHMEVVELREWLSLTRFHDEEYRRRTIHRHKRLAALEQEKAELMREEQDERELISRGGIGLLHSTAVVPSNLNPPHIAMPQYPSELNANHLTRSNVLLGNGLLDSSPAPKSDLESRETPELFSLKSNTPRLSQSGLKRQGSSEETATTNSERQKVARYTRLHEAEVVKADLTPGSHNVTDLVHDSSRYDRTYHDRVRIHGRGRQPESNLGDWRSKMTPDQSVAPVRRFQFDEQNTKFFLIKSFEYHYVEASQRDGLWVVQSKNAGKITEAFNTSRHVIFFFSVNNSKAFQGYARLETAPGDNKLEAPRWAFNSSNPTCKVKWMNTNEVLFKHLGRLNNVYNEGKAVFVGRDGQGVDAKCGVQLCLSFDAPAR
ncbi:hypothetical protein FQN57_002474 [Myotisia sp. PD_48]|nr:hypothetical protein FQN57_002474 [Myotisia sp. PD_48]